MGEFKEHLAELTRLQAATDKGFDERASDGGRAFVAAHGALIRHLAKPAASLDGPTPEEPK